MSIVFSAIVPHSPFLIPSIGKENQLLLKNTLASFKKLEEDLYASKAESIVIISPHGTVQPNSFTMNISPDYNIDFNDFGDLVTRFNLNGDIGLAHKIRERMETRAPLQVISEKRLDYGSGVPLFLLTQHLSKIKIIPVFYSGLDFESHFKFGQLLKRELMVNKDRIAVIASGDLSHKISKNSPAGYSPKAKKFDQKIINLLSNKKNNEIIKLKHTLVSEVCECGLKSIITLLGIMDGIKYNPQVYSYESPFGVGYLTMNFGL